MPPVFSISPRFQGFAFRAKIFLLRSDMRARSDWQGQDRDERSLRDRTSGQSEEADKDGAAGAESGLEREVSLVSCLPKELRWTQLEMDFWF